MEGKDSDRTALTSNVTREDAMDTNFIRSLEGILRVVALVSGSFWFLALTTIILNVKLHISNRYEDL